MSPVEAFATAIDVLALLHVPPVMALLSVVIVPWQMDVVPVIDATGLTVTVAVVVQPAVVV